MLSFIALQIPTHTFLDLAAYLRLNGDARDPADIAGLAIEAWLAKAKHDSNPGPSDRGYQWKNVFLPEGSRIRMKYKGEWRFADVEGDTIVYHGRAVSPRELANSIAGATRNAWRDLWIRFPGELRWKLASFRRLDAIKLDRPVAKDSPTAQAPSTLVAPVVLAAQQQSHHLQLAGRRSELCDRRMANMDD